MKFFYTKITTIITIVGLLFLYGAVIVFSAPPGTQYNPAETLDPACLPGDVNCSVVVSNIYNTDGTLAEERVFNLGYYNLDFENINQVNFRSDNGADFVKFIDDDQGFTVSLYSDYYGGDNSWVFESPNGESMMIGGINNGNGGNDILIGADAESTRIYSDRTFVESDAGGNLFTINDNDLGQSMSASSDYFGGDLSWVFESGNGESMMIGGINNGNGGNDILIGDSVDKIRLLTDVFIEGVTQDDTEDKILVLDTVNERIEYRNASTLGGGPIAVGTSRNTLYSIGLSVQDK